VGIPTDQSRVRGPTQVRFCPDSDPISKTLENRRRRKCGGGGASSAVHC
jgi:hypothetical protein